MEILALILISAASLIYRVLRLMPSDPLTRELDMNGYDDLSASLKDDALYVTGARVVRRVPYEQIHEVEVAALERGDLLRKRARYAKHRLFVYLPGEVLEITRPLFWKTMKETAALLRQRVKAARERQAAGAPVA